MRELFLLKEAPTSILSARMDVGRTVGGEGFDARRDRTKADRVEEPSRTARLDLERFVFAN